MAPMDLDHVKSNVKSAFHRGNPGELESFDLFERHVLRQWVRINGYEG